MVEQEQRRIFLVGRFSGALELAGRRGHEIVLRPPWRVARSLDWNFFSLLLWGSFDLIDGDVSAARQSARIIWIWVDFEFEIGLGSIGG